VEEGLPVAQAANMGITAAFDGSGHELGRLPWGQPDSLVIALPSPQLPTIFSRYGRSLPIILCAFGVVLAVFLGRHRK